MSATFSCNWKSLAHPRTRGTSSIQSPDQCLSGSWVAASRVSSSAIRSRGGASRGASFQINWLSHCGQEGGPAEPMRDVIYKVDFRSGAAGFLRDLWQAVRVAGARWMVVEHDKPADPAETARAYVFISRMGV